MSKSPVVRVTSLAFTVKTLANGRALNLQPAMFERGDGVVLPLQLLIQPGQPFQPGEYSLLPDSYVPNKYGDVEFRPRIELIAPAKAASVAAVK